MFIYWNFKCSYPTRRLYWSHRLPRRFCCCNLLPVAYFAVEHFSGQKYIVYRYRLTAASALSEIANIHFCTGTNLSDLFTVRDSFPLLDIINKFEDLSKISR